MRAGAVERIYLQKGPGERLQAQNFLLAPQYAPFVDWGDNLESVTWTHVVEHPRRDHPVRGHRRGPDRFPDVARLRPGVQRALGSPRDDPADLAMPATPTATHELRDHPPAERGHRVRQAQRRRGGLRIAFALRRVVRVDRSPTLWMARSRCRMPRTPRAQHRRQVRIRLQLVDEEVRSCPRASRRPDGALTFYAPDVPVTPDTVTTPPVLPDSRR